MERSPTFEAAAWKRAPETHDYRETVAQALVMAKNYDGSEARYDGLTQQLIVLEDVIKKSPSLQHLTADNRETAGALLFTPQRPRDIQEILDIAIKARNRALHASLMEDEDAEEGEENDETTTDQSHSEIITPEKKPSQPIYVVRIKAVLLPTNPSPLPEATEHPAAFERGDFQTRLQDVLNILESLGVYTDDIIIMIGKHDPKMMRKVSYAAVQIPRLERMVLVCDQVGEATFVIRGSVPTETLLRLSKDELQQQLGSRIHRIERRNEDKWKKELQEWLGSDSIWDNPKQISSPPKPRPKIDAREYYRDQLVEALRATFTPKQWVELPYKIRKHKQIDGKGFQAIASIFDIRNPLNNTLNHLLLGEKIFGANNSVITTALTAAHEAAVLDSTLSARSPEEWATQIKKQYTPEEWVSWSQKERTKKDIDEKKLVAIGTIFGIGDPIAYTYNHLLLGEKIYGADNEVIKSALAIAKMEEEKRSALPDVSKRTLEEWVTRIKERYTAEQWIALEREERIKLDIDGKKITAIGSIFGIARPLDTTLKYLRLGEKIYGADNEVIKPALAIAIMASQI